MNIDYDTGTNDKRLSSGHTAQNVVQKPLGLVVGTAVCWCALGQNYLAMLPRVDVSECWLVVQGDAGTDGQPCYIHSLLLLV